MAAPPRSGGTPGLSPEWITGGAPCVALFGGAVRGCRVGDSLLAALPRRFSLAGTLPELVSEAAAELVSEAAAEMVGETAALAASTSTAPTARASR